MLINNKEGNTASIANVKYAIMVSTIFAYLNYYEDHLIFEWNQNSMFLKFRLIIRI